MNQCIESPILWKDPTVLLSAVKPELSYSQTYILSSKKTEFLESIVKAIESNETQVNTLAGEVLSEIAKNCPPYLIQPFSALLNRLFEKQLSKQATVTGV